MPLKALIFDVDGTLAETEEAHRQAFNETFVAYGLDWHWSFDDYLTLHKTTGGKERIKVHAKTLGMALDDDLVKRMHAQKTQRYGEIVASGGIDLRSGIVELIAEAEARGLPLAIATTTNRPNVDTLIEATLGRPAAEIFPVICAGDEVARKKPAPDVYQLALTRLGLAPETCLAFEDSHNGLVAARAAGLTTIVSPSLFTHDEDFDGAALIVDDYASLSGLDSLESLLAAA